jgi:hypothetical protein
MTGGDTPDELEGLLMGLVDGDLSPVESERLADLLRDDPALREKYVDYLLVDSLLHWEQTTAVPAPTPAPPRPRRRLWPAVATAGALAATLLVALGLWLRTPPLPPADLQAAEPTDDTVAVLSSTSRASWADSSLPTRPGAPLPPGRMRLTAGVVRLELYCGATVIVEGPAEFRLVSRARVDCSEGKLWATVPPHAEGFTVGTPTIDLVDRGTEFGVRVGGRGETEVYVFQGKVELYGAGAAGRVPPTRALTTGQGVRVGPAGASDPAPPDPGGFVTTRELEGKLSAEARLRQDQWREAAEAWRRDPGLRVYFPFQGAEPGDRVLGDRAGDGPPSCDGAVVGCSWVAGRWPGRQGLEFKRVSDRVRLHVPGEFQSLTLAAWVRVDGLPNRNNSLLMADGWEEGELHWQIGHDGTLILGVQTRPPGRGAHYHAPWAVTPGRFGQWMHLAVTYDADARRVTHYVDGRPVAAEPVLSGPPLRLGDAEVGNWNVAGYRNNIPVRHLSGRMDEFMLFVRALSAEEMGRLYSQSRPPS